MSKDTDAISEMAEPVLNRLREKLQKDDKWKNETISGTNYGLVKAAPPTIKGTFGEELIALFMDKIVGVPAEIIDGGKGPYDLRTQSNVTFEIKLATEDIHGGFQFNGLKKDVEYDFAFCLGVSPKELWFGIWSKKDVKELTTSMTKNGSDTYKLTAKKNANAKYPVILLTEESFYREVSKIV